MTFTIQYLLFITVKNKNMAALRSLLIPLVPSIHIQIFRLMLSLEYFANITGLSILTTVKGLYFSKAACVELGTIKGNFSHFIDSIELAAATSDDGPCQDGHQ